MTPSELQRQFCSMKSFLTWRSPKQKRWVVSLARVPPSTRSGTRIHTRSAEMLSEAEPLPSRHASLAQYSYLFPARTTGNKSCNFSTSGPFDSSNGLWERHTSRRQNRANKSCAVWAAPTPVSPGQDTDEPCRAAPGHGQSRFPPPLSTPDKGLEVSPASRINPSSLRWFNATRMGCSAVGELQHVSLQHSLVFSFKILVKSPNNGGSFLGTVLDSLS